MLVGDSLFRLLLLHTVLAKEKGELEHYRRGLGRIVKSKGVLDSNFTEKPECPRPLDGGREGVFLWGREGPKFQNPEHIIFEGF